MLPINYFWFVNKVKGLSMKTYVDSRRILLVERQTSVSLGIWSSMHKVCYNDITKKTCSIPDARSQPLPFSRLKTHVVGKIESLTAIVTHTWKLLIPFKHWDDCIYVSGIIRSAEIIVNFFTSREERNC